MTAESVRSRATARQALELIENIDASLTSEQRKGVPVELNGMFRRTIGARWIGLPNQFVKDWSAHAAQQSGILVRILRKICRYRYGYLLVSWLRRTLRV